MVQYSDSDVAVWSSHTETGVPNILGRAKKWLNPAVTFSDTNRQNGYLANAEGYVAFSWGLLNNNATLLDITTYSYQVSSDVIQAGDVLINVVDNNAVVFGSWANPTET